MNLYSRCQPAVERCDGTEVESANEKEQARGARLPFCAVLEPACRASRHPVLTHLSRCAVQMGHICALRLAQISTSVPPYGRRYLLSIGYHWLKSNREEPKQKGHAMHALCFELVGQNCNSVKRRILCLRFINTEIIPLNTVLVNRFLKSFCKIIETLSYYFLCLMYKTLGSREENQS